MEKLRIHKYLAQSGVCSRRKAEEYIDKGFVFVNGEKATIGQIIDPEVDSIKVQEELIKKTEKFVYYKINKPRGVVTTCKSLGEKAIVDIIDIPERVFPIGRLDKDTTGLILLTNDGRLSNYLIHPRYEHEKEYIVQVYGTIQDEQLEKLSRGIFILGKITKEAKIERINSGAFSIVLTEGRNRQIRRMVASIDKEVKKLKRIRIENILLGDLKEGEYEELSKKELDALFKRIGLE
ncbi:MAG: pseudouridine synthase [Candidatus Gracilibacteria bacterium]|nr:pseudouridine synthase [Candidatus Gracilibacteria bacterium]